LNHRPRRLSRIRDTLVANLRDRGIEGTASVIGDYLRWKTRYWPLPWHRSEEVLRHRANASLVRSMSGAPWMRLVRSAQKEIAASSHDTDLDEYQTQEVYYWTEIARWLHEGALGSEWSRSLDVGCGFGTLSVYLSHLTGGEVCSIDMLENRFTRALADRSGIDFVWGNIELEPLPWDGPFDVIVFTEVLEHLNFYPVPTLVELRKALSPEGRLFLSTPDAAEWGRVTTYYPSLDDMPSPDSAIPLVRSGEWGYVDAHVWQYSRDELQRVVEEAGLRVVREGLAPGVVHRHFNLELARS
jgi:2-polyprenyl-3-methyl-5-hydroxy-6-metoxy-1,4-benzoquinol methylase